MNSWLRSAFPSQARPADPPSRMTLSGPLKWALGLTLASTAYALLRPLPTVAGGQAGAQDAPSGSIGLSMARDSLAMAATEAMPAPVFEAMARADPKAAAGGAPSTFDPFVGVVAAAVQTAPLAAVAPPPPPPPLINYRFMGRMTAPDGTRELFLTTGENAVPVQVGTSLDGGYVIEDITASNIVLSVPGSEAKATIALPAEASP